MGLDYKRFVGLKMSAHLGSGKHSSNIV